MKKIEYRFLQFHLFYINFRKAVNCKYNVKRKSISDDAYDYAMQSDYKK